MNESVTKLFVGEPGYTQFVKYVYIYIYIGRKMSWWDNVVWTNV